MPQRMMLSVQATPDTDAIRTAELFDEEHTVIPCIALVEGVLWPANAPAPELALAEEFGRFPDGWNGRPVVFDHPRIQGEPVSASSPDVLEDVGFGQLFNTELKGAKLHTEIWINEERVKDMSDEVKDTVDRLKSGDETVEVSTGLFTMNEIASGEFDGEEFEAIWRNIVPDHLAILPEGIKGACSVEDGCGAPRTNQMHPVMRAAQMSTKASDASKKGVFQKLAEYAKKLGGNLLQIRDSSEDLSDNDTRTAIQGALSSEENWFWIMAVFDDGGGSGTFVYESFDSSKLFRREFTIDEGGSVTIGAEKVEVRPVTQFVDVVPEGDVTDNTDGTADAETQDGSIQENSMKDKDQLVSDLIANEATRFEDGDRDWLTALEESQLASLAPVEVAKPDEVIDDDTIDTIDATVVGDTVVENANTPPITTDEYIAAAPDEVKEVLNSGLRMHRSRKDALVSAITENERCTFSADQLNAKSLDELEQIASLATDVTFEGQAPIVSRDHDDDTPPAPIPLFDLNESAAA